MAAEPDAGGDAMTDRRTTITHAAGEVRLAAGEVATFGRAQPEGDGGGDPGPHLGLSASSKLHAVAGEVRAEDDGWVLANRGRWLHIRLIRRDGPDRADVAPGRSLRVPWARARVEVATGDEVVGFDVDCPVIERGADRAAPLPSGETVGGLDLDRTAGYFRALVALCAPRLRDPASTEVATVAEVARMLSGLPGEPDRVTVKAVERRLAHVRARVGIGGDPSGVSAAGLEVRDASRQLVDLALRTGTVTPSDLALVAPDVPIVDR